FLRLRLGVTDGSNFWIAVRHLRNVHVFDNHRVEARDLFRDEDALLISAMGELQTWDDVADGVDPRNVGLETVVREHKPTIHRNAYLFEAETLSSGAATDCDEEIVSFNRRSV